MTEHRLGVHRRHHRQCRAPRVGLDGRLAGPSRGHWKLGRGQRADLGRSRRQPWNRSRAGRPSGQLRPRRLKARLGLNGARPRKRRRRGFLASASKPRLLGSWRSCHRRSGGAALLGSGRGARLGSPLLLRRLRTRRLRGQGGLPGPPRRHHSLHGHIRMGHRSLRCFLRSRLGPLLRRSLDRPGGHRPGSWGLSSPDAGQQMRRSPANALHPVGRRTLSPRLHIPQPLHRRLPRTSLASDLARSRSRLGRRLHRALHGLRGSHLPPTRRRWLGGLDRLGGLREDRLGPGLHPPRQGAHKHVAPAALGALIHG